MRQLATAFADHIANDAEGQLIESGNIPLGNYGELGIIHSIFNPCLRAAMYTDYLAGDLDYLGLRNICTTGTCTDDNAASIILAAWQLLLDNWTSAMDDAGVTISWFVQTANYSFRNWERTINDYAATLGIGPSHNKITEDSGEAYSYGNYGGGWAQFDAFVNHQEEVYSRGEATDSDNGIPPNVGPPDVNLIEQQYWAIMNAIDKHIDMLAVNFELTNPWPFPSYQIQYGNNQIYTALDEFNQLAGKTATTAPFALSVLRETQWTSPGAWSMCGDFDFYLYHQICNPPRASFCPLSADPPTGGCDEPVWDAIPEKTCTGDGVGQGTFDPNCDPRGRFARKTKAGNPYMFFDIDNLFAFGEKNLIAQLTFADIGTDNITVQCLNTLGGIVSNAHAKTNSRSWVTVDFSLPGCNLSNAMESGSDFAIYDNQDGYEIVHKVKVSVENGAINPTAAPTLPASPTPTRTPTLPASPTPTRTPTLPASPTPTRTPTLPASPTPTPTPTLSSTATPWRMIVLGPNDVAWKDAHLLSQSPDQTTGRWNTIGLRAGTSATVVPLPTEHPSTIKSGLVEVPFALPATPRAAYLSYYVASASLGSGTAYVKPCKMAREWVENEATWNRSAATVAWQTPGAYGATDIGPCGTPVPIATTDVGHYVTFNVGTMLESDGLSVKLEPECTPNTLGYCNADYNLQAGRLGAANPPRLEVWVNSTVATWTPTPTRTRTPTRTPTATMTLSPTPTTTPTATASASERQLRRPPPR